MPEWIAIGTHLDRFPSQDEEGLGSLSEETRELVDQDVLNLVCLLDTYTDPHTVYTGLNKNFLVFISSHGERVEEHFW